MNFQPGRDVELPGWMVDVVTSFPTPTLPCQINENSGIHEGGEAEERGRGGWEAE